MISTDGQRVGLNGLRHFSRPKDGGGTNDDLARPLQHPLLSGQLEEKKISSICRVLASYASSENVGLKLSSTSFQSQHLMAVFATMDRKHVQTYLCILVHSLVYDVSHTLEH